MSLFWSLFPKDSPIIFWEFNYDLRRWTKGIAGDVYSASFIPVGWSLPYSSFSIVLLKLKYRFVSAIWSLYWDTHWSLVSWMLLGDISPMTKDEYEWFLGSSLVHLVAVSWGNLVFVAALLTILLFFLPFYLRIVLVFIFVWLYSWLVGFDSSVFRALVMFGLVYGARGSWRISSITTSMIYAWVFLLCINPYMLLYDLGFILSFWALAWILISAKVIEKSQNFFQRCVKNYLLPSIWASFWTYPILLYFTWSINLLGIAWNIVVVPFVPLIMVLSLLSLLFNWSLLGNLVLSTSRYLLSSLLYISDRSNTWWVIIWWDKPMSTYLSLGFLWMYLLWYGMINFFGYENNK